MTDGVMVLTFDEVIDAASVNPAGFQLQSAADASLGAVTVSSALAGSVIQIDSTIITMTLTTTSANGVRALTGLAVDAATTYLRVATTALTDVDENDVNAKPSTAALQTQGFTGDLVPPVATRFELNMTSETLVIHFDQPIDGSTANLTQITLQNLATGATSTHELAAGTHSNDVATWIVISLATADVNEIKREDVCANGLNPENGCFLSLSNAFIQDATLLTVPSVPGNAAIQILAADYTADEIAPAVVTRGFTSFDLNSGQITLSFTETVDRSTLDGTTITLQSFIDSPDYTFTLEPVTVVSSTDGTTLVFSVSESDLNQIKINPNLCTLRMNCYLHFNASMIADMAGNSIAASVTDPNERVALLSYAQQLTTDTTDPSVLSFSLNMDSSRLVLSFDETVRVSSLRPQFITLQSSGNSSSTSHTLSVDADTVITDSDGTSMTILIATSDLNEIKTLRFCTSDADTFISFTSAMVSDTSADGASSGSGNPVTPVVSAAAMQVTTYVADQTKPRLGAFSLFLDSSELHLTFNEPVSTDSINFAALSLLSNRSSTAVSRRLTPGTVQTAADTVSTIIVLILAEADVVFYKSDPALATATANTYLSADEGAGTDAASVTSIAVTRANALLASGYREDQIRASLQGYTINMETRKLILTFNEVIDASTFTPELLHIQSQADNTN
jgi:hypothetical protein